MGKMKPEEKILQIPEGFDKPFMQVNCFDNQFGDVLMEMDDAGYIPIPGLTNAFRVKLPDPDRKVIGQTLDGFTILFKRKDLCVCQCEPNQPK